MKPNPSKNVIDDDDDDMYGKALIIIDVQNDFTSAYFNKSMGKETTPSELAVNGSLDII